VSLHLGPPSMGVARRAYDCARLFRCQSARVGIPKTEAFIPAWLFGARCTDAGKKWQEECQSPQARCMEHRMAGTTGVLALELRTEIQLERATQQHLTPCLGQVRKATRQRLSAVLLMQQYNLVRVGGSKR
jgi:hypothetical protein